MPIINKYILTLSVIFFLCILTSSNAFAETTAPITTYVQAPAIPDGNNNWHVTPVSFELYGNDIESGIHQIFYQIDNGTWQNKTFSDTQNEVLNPSFEDTSSEYATNLTYWGESVDDDYVTYSQDTSAEADSGFGSAVAKIQTTQGDWHGINNKQNYIPVEPYDSMTASIFIKTEGTVDGAGFKIYAVKDVAGEIVYEELTTASFITAAPIWQRVALSFTVNDAEAIGVYMDIGLEGTGTIWADAAYLSNSLTDTKVQFTVGNDSETHQVAFYSVDNDGNTETYTCTLPAKNCISFKLDQVAPTNWRGSGAIRGLFGNSYDLWVFTLVDDDTSGIDTDNAQYMYHTELNTGFGRFSELLSCAGTWQDDLLTPLSTPGVDPGDNTVYVVTEKTSFCNNDWKQCKTVRFFAQDMAGNISSKDFCINGPWIKARQMGIVRSNNDIDMLSEAYGYNTDGLIEAKGSSIGFFNSTKGWRTTGANTLKNIGYDELFDLTDAKTEKFIGDPLNPESGVFVRNHDAILNETTLPEGYDTIIYDKITFVNGSLTIDTDVDILPQSTLLFIVKDDVYISKNVVNSDFGIIADGDIYTAYDVTEGEATEALTLNGIYTANKFIFQRTLQGTDNDQNPSEIFNFEPKYAQQLKQFFIKSTVKWVENE